jgi:hypothetical protein
VVLGTICGHILGAALFVLQAGWCRATGLCMPVAFDPNVYRVIFTSAKTPGYITDFAILAWLVELALVGVLTGALIAWAARRDWIKGRWDAIDFGWLNSPVQEVRGGNAVILAYVVTKTSYEGANIAYEGMVQQLAMDDDQIITMLVLRRVDRFLVRITPEGMTRTEEEHQPIAQMQLHLGEIANVALEIIERPST